MSSRKISPEHKYNIVLLGPVGVGKSALTVKYITKRFIMDYDPFIEGTYTKIDVVDNHEVLVKVRDTYMENILEIDKYLKWADGYLVVYSVTSQDSFEQAQGVLEILSQHTRACPMDCPIVLVGNKADLDRYRQVSKTEGNALAAQYDCKAFCETAASEEFATVESAFHVVIKEIQRERDIGSLGSCLDLPPLFIREEQSKCMSLPAGSVAPKGGAISGANLRRVKTSKLGSSSIVEEHKRRLDAGKKPPGSGFRIFNKSFKIFN